ncbi:hypothetical protein F6455_05720 [Proteobacteria bacterium 005FR1]|nr:hypothetical protein [Proteobacteria bacterium 005FR1]
MTDEKEKARSKILGELESIRTLLEDENGNTLDPPLLTDPLEDDEASLLTVTWEAQRPESSDTPRSIDAEPNDADIPTLEADLDAEIPTLNADAGIPVLDVPAGPEQASLNIEVEPKESDDIVSRALKGQPRPSLFDDPEPEPPNGGETGDAPEEVDSERMSAGKTEGNELRAEEQPGLFDIQPPAEVENNPQEVSPASATGKRDSAVAKKSENPFLPKHIRDRLSANRALQAELVKSFTSPPYTPFPPTARKPALDAEVDEQLVDQLVRRYLPKIEAELREKLRAVLRDERERSGKPEQD